MPCEKCLCGRNRGRRKLTCLPCWKSLPQALTRRWRASEKGSTERLGVAREILRTLRDKRGQEYHPLLDGPAEPNAIEPKPPTIRFLQHDDGSLGEYEIE